MTEIMTVFGAPAGLSIVLTVAGVSVMRALIRKWGLERSNFKGNVIPAGFGFVLVLAGVPVYAVMLFIESDLTAVLFLAAVMGFGILGLLDDIYGTREASGFRGHLGLLRRGTISTGLIEAVGGGALGLGLGAAAAGFELAPSLVNGLVIGLFANMLNLLDLRPGRAVSCYWLAVTALALVPEWRFALMYLLLPILGPVVWLTAMDRSAKIMLGDAGSNVLGALVGLVAVHLLGLPAKIALVALLAGAHLYSENYSISELIEGNRLLRGIDRLLGER